MPGLALDEDRQKSDTKLASLPYPSFSKAHSKEAVGSRPALNIFTPPTTDVNASKDKLANAKTTAGSNAPPSPPLTDQNAGRWKGGGGKAVSVETIPEEQRTENQETKLKVRLRPKASQSNGHLRSASELGPSASPTKARNRDKDSTPLRRADIHILPQRSVSQPTTTASPDTTESATEIATNVSSEATSIAPEQPRVQRPGSKVPPSGAFADAPPQPPQTPGQQPPSYGPTPVEIFLETESPSLSATPASHHPPPPPPPPAVPVSIPKVDYLLQNGGLHQTVPKNLLCAGKPMAIQQAMSPSQPPIVVANLFEPYNQLLDDFEKVMTQNGSLAVATGYRSVARRLLDRLEAVFARDISSEACRCCMCEPDLVDDVRGVSWGEILELVSGRKDLPVWPPFSFVTSPVGLGISLELHVPMQKLDIDVPEEYREHYIRQSRKTKQSVDKWLNRQSDTPSSPPEEVDDDTLTFAILTHLPVEQRPVFKDLLGIVDRPLGSPRRAPTPEPGSAPPALPTLPPRLRPEHITTVGLAIQRLYRLAVPPRDSETALFMLNNPTVHNSLATLAAISNDEWDILISGRFDGFLRSGADDVPDPGPYARPNSYRGPRGPTPIHLNGHSRNSSYSRSNTPAAVPAQYGAPITFDEETEIATLAEIERDIYISMEALEDAFEALHQKAETVRRTLRERSAGLAAAAQRRRGANSGGVEVRMGTPGSGIADKWEVETDDGLGDWDGVSELAPDDSASNVSTSRRRRPKRRNERRTPALIEEEDELDEYAESEEGTASPRKR